MASEVVPVGIAQEAVAIALERSREALATGLVELQARRDVVHPELHGLPVGVPAGGWSLLVRVSGLGLDGKTASERRLKHAVCATVMNKWGEEHGKPYIRYVFLYEPVSRLQGSGAKVRKALDVQWTGPLA
ncbi:uncharacterized protein ACLA_067050 [Aspergillus clavatus NRRL 1]|uniref:Uncharacterized protein n=1 Tax=Aspergillus clavatus (strain ATCC 1007 / CBS 513.65 / DSM 816 / NCTC 3887 / NRRL 1 / QM 1276 / 107) TaxID=344612 RepID=A1CGI9_ASPCL|nr:uncharacterized protein ACLA_067050 [Aspergillus clavatus NRRL 1]EAW11069.1 hypothetical protein ACLA_067050 [Aspergillus clavatus NRRL 1]